MLDYNRKLNLMYAKQYSLRATEVVMLREFLRTHNEDEYYVFYNEHNNFVTVFTKYPFYKVCYTFNSISYEDFLEIREEIRKKDTKDE